MDKLDKLDKIKYLIRRVSVVSTDLRKGLGVTDRDQSVLDSIGGLNEEIEKANSFLNSGALLQAQPILKGIESQGLLIALMVQRGEASGVIGAAMELEQLCIELQRANEDLFLPVLTSDGYLVSNIEDGRNADYLQMKNQYAELLQQGERIARQAGDSEARISTLEGRIAELENDAALEIGKVVQAYSDAIVIIEGKKAEIDDILGHAAGRAIAGDYEKSAAEERKMADWLRYGTIACMILIVSVLFSAVISTIGGVFEWDRFISRVSLVFLLSLPAAYLARESAKHREQQYQHLQTSLDMKAVSPFLASLPEEERHKLKAAIASRIFGGRDVSRIGGDSYPINTHEIIMEIIKRLDISEKGVKRDSNPSA